MFSRIIALAVLALPLRCRSSCDGHDRHRRIVQHRFPPVLQVCSGREFELVYSNGDDTNYSIAQVVCRPAGPRSLEHPHRRRYCRSVSTFFL